jgi:hypothetical protein
LFPSKHKLNAPLTRFGDVDIVSCVNADLVVQSYDPDGLGCVTVRDAFEIGRAGMCFQRK